MTHSDLIKIAAAWLRKKRHSVIITDMSSAAQETPDAIGWGGGSQSTLIEAKASRADFLADKWKPWRRDPERGMGNCRYYITSPGIIKIDELPPKWGLLEVTGEKVRIKVTAGRQKSNQLAENRLLISAIRRVGNNPPPGLSVQCYIMETKCRATIGIEPAPIGPAGKSEDTEWSAGEEWHTP